MLKTLLTQTGWNLLGTIFAFGVGFFVKMFLVNAIGANNFGLYIIATSFQAALSTFLALELPNLLLKFLPTFLTNNDFSKANALASKILIILFFTGTIGALIVFSFNKVIATRIFDNSELAPYIALAAFYIPLTLLNSYITSLYRTVLRIKEIVLYGTFYMVSVRALLTFVIYSFVTDVAYFMLIEIFSYITATFLMFLRFQQTNLTVFEPFSLKKPIFDETIRSYWKKIYTLSIVGVAGGYIMTFLMSILLLPSAIGIYAVLGTIAGLTSFLLQNINRIFSPIISTLVAKKDYDTLALIYKDSTFLINIITIPFILSVILFSKPVLTLYGSEFSHYDLELLILFLGNYATISVGSSGTIMVMGGLEKYSLGIQIFKIVYTAIASILLLPVLGLLGAVLVFATLSFFVNFIEVSLIKKHLSIFPLDKLSFSLFLLFIVSLIFLFVLKKNEYEFWQYICFPLGIYLLFFLIFFKRIQQIITDIKYST